MIISHLEILLGFESSEYSFSESAGNISESVYIVRENPPVTVSTSFNVTVLKLSQSTASNGKLISSI